MQRPRTDATTTTPGIRFCLCSRQQHAASVSVMVHEPRTHYCQTMTAAAYSGFCDDKVRQFALAVKSKSTPQPRSLLTRLPHAAWHALPRVATTTQAGTPLLR